MADRSGPTATTLEDGSVLVAGGVDLDCEECGSDATAEVYDPATDTWTPTPPMNFSHAGHTATCLKDGAVLVAGSGTNAELFFP